MSKLGVVTDSNGDEVLDSNGRAQERLLATDSKGRIRILAGSGNTGGVGVPATNTILAPLTTGASAVAFAETASCTSVLVSNISTDDLKVRIGGAGQWFPIPGRSALELTCAHPNELSFMRLDGAASPAITVYGLAITY